MTLTFARTVAGLVNTVLFILIARESGPASYGNLAAFIAMLGYLAQLADFGMSTYLPFARALKHSKKVLSTLRFNRLTTTSMILLVGAFWLIMGSTKTAPLQYLMLILSVALEKNTDTSLSISVADKKMTVIPISLSIRRFSTMIAWALLYYCADLDVILAYCISTLIGAVLGQVHSSLWVHNYVGSTGPVGGVFSMVRTLLPFAISNATGNVRNLDSPVCSLVAGGVQTGLYSGATRLVSPFFLFSSTLSQVILPHSSTHTPPAARRLALRLTTWHIVLLALCIVFSFFSPYLVPLILGISFKSATAIFSVSIISLPIVALSAPLGSILQGQHQQRFVATNGVVFSVVSVACFTIGAWLLGGLGVAIGLAVSYLLKDTSLVIRLLRITIQRPSPSSEDVLPDGPEV